MSEFKILFIGKKNDHFSTIAAEYLKVNIPSTIIFFSEKGEIIPTSIYNWKGDYIISYLSQWIIPPKILSAAKYGGINLHPGSPEYPGIGCTNFAIYNGENKFGITCHFMLPKVDTGSIIKVYRFPIYPLDNVYTVTQRCYNQIMQCFFELIDMLILGIQPVASDENWKRLPYTRKELNELCKLDDKMDKIEIQKRLRATTFGDKIWAFYEVNKEKIYYKNNI
jgi:methionyl-tRNA formyltransferase